MSAVLDRLRAGDKLHLQFVAGRRVWWFEAPHQVVPESAVASALSAGLISESGDSLFGLPMNSQTFYVDEKEPPEEDPSTPATDQQTGNLFREGG